VDEAENTDEKSSIIKLGVRVVNYDNFVSTQTGKESKEPEKDFRSGKGISPNAGRTLKRSMRRNLQRYKLRRENLIEILKKHSFIIDEAILSENGNRTTFETYRLRAKAVNEKISLEEFARILLMINKKRGYKSSRKAKSSEDGKLIDGMEVAKMLYDENLMPGQLVLELLRKGKKEPDFYRSDLQAEFDKIWKFQKQFYPEILTDNLYKEVRAKNKGQTWTILKEPLSIVGIKQKGKYDENKIERYLWRTDSLTKKQDLEVLAIVFQEINHDINNSSGYLGAISDRSKELYFNKQTVGQYLMAQLDKDPNISLKNQVFYRQDYLDEFNTIWDKQAEYHEELTDELKQEIRDIIIFYQRRLKSQKGLISFCEFESREIEKEIDGKKKIKTVGSRVIPRSSPLFQEFKIWQILNNIEVFGKGQKKKKKKNDLPDLFSDMPETLTQKERRGLHQEEKELLAVELSIREKLTKGDALKLLFENYKELDLNYEKIEGNQTQAVLLKAYEQIIEYSGHEIDFEKKTAKEVIDSLKEIFVGMGINTDILYFDSNKALDEQPMYKLWHLLYSFEGDNSNTGNEKLIDKLVDLYGFEKEYATILVGVTFKDDYGSLSAKAIRKILPHLKEGNAYDVACEYAGYRHSKKSLTKEELANKPLKNKLDILPKNSLRNPVVEKILNQMVNVVNSIIDTYGKPDEIRIELARELKKNAKEREELTKAINKATNEHAEIRKILQNDFGINNVSHNDIIRYKLYKELEPNGYKTLYSNTYISQEKLFSKDFDIEHIIPQAKRFDDSFSNKTIELRGINLEKGNATAYDFVKTKYGEVGLEEYINRIETLFISDKTKKAKLQKLKMQETDIPDGFIERDIRDTQYIAKKAKEMLEELVRHVVSTTGSVTDRLREDWQLVDVMKELNWEKYNKLGLTEITEDKDGRKICKIKDWTKRNDHRHHAMDALTVAFTKRSFIQYLNNLNARRARDEQSISNADKEGWERSSITTDDILSTRDVLGIEKKELHRDEKNKLRFNPPMTLDEFREKAKRHLANILISIKSKNKVVTVNVNISKKKGGLNKKKQLTLRGQLHNETIYGSYKQYVVIEKRIGASFDETQITKVCKPIYREALLKRLFENDNDPKKAFTGKNNLAKNPIYLDELHTMQMPEKVKTINIETVYTIRKEISPDLKIEKVIDVKIKQILEIRLKKYNDDPKEAFSNLDENPIWLNEKKGIRIKRVTISGISNAEPLHIRRDNNGNVQPVDFVNTGNNHHVAIYRDTNGNLQEKVVSFYDAVKYINYDFPIIMKNPKEIWDKVISEGIDDQNLLKKLPDESWQFLFSMKQNEYFVFPNEKTGFNPNGIDLLNTENNHLISPNLYRVQKIGSKDYNFRNHLESSVKDNISILSDITWKRIRSPKDLKEIVKVRINHIGQIVSIGEY
jgi:CRISPR-associated endonuclease Csn1